MADSLLPQRRRAVTFYPWLWWTRFLDVVKPKRDYAGRYPRVTTLSPAESERFEEILRRHRVDGHETMKGSNRTAPRAANAGATAPRSEP